MATLSFDNETPVLCAETTATGGTGTITLSGVAPTGHRTLDTAAAVGHVSDGDVLAYMIRDTATPPDFEFNTGVWNSSSKTLTRNTPMQSSSGVSKINWPGTGARDVYIVANLSTTTITPAKIGAAGLNDPNTFLANQTINPGAATGLLTIASTLSTGVPGQLRFAGQSSAGGTEFYGFIRPRILDSTEGSEDSVLEFIVDVAGTATEIIQMNGDGSLDNVVAGTKFDNFASGTTTDFYQATAPIGWNRVTTGIDGCAVRLVTAGSPGTATTAGRSNVGTATVTISSAQMPPHNHQTLGGAFSGFIRSWVSGDPGPNNWLTTAADPDKGTAVYVADVATASSGSGGPLSLSLRVADFLLATKAA